MKLDLKVWLHSIQQAFVPAYCLVCRAGTELEADICPYCYADLPWLEHACQHCALPLAPEADSDICLACSHRPLFHQTLAGFDYQRPISWLVTGLKYRGQTVQARLLGWLLAQQIRHHALSQPDLLIPVPLHRAAFRRRGFNQAELIAQYLAGQLDWAMSTAHFSRIRDTPRQSRLKAAQRRANLKTAFRAQKPVQGLHITLLDDVMTTASTMRSLALCARQAGARRVDIVCLARA